MNWGYIGIMERRIETTIISYGIYWGYIGVIYTRILWEPKCILFFYWFLVANKGI